MKLKDMLKVISEYEYIRIEDKNTVYFSGLAKNRECSEGLLNCEVANVRVSMDNILIIEL